MDGALWLLATWAVPAIVAITLHEAAHGYAALRFGDDTAARAGRLSLNPLRHVDPFGTLLLPALLLLSHAGFLFGYAKPVPVNFRRLHNLRRDMVLVAAAGPAMNLFLALLSAILYQGQNWLGFGPRNVLAVNLINSIWINILLAVFNMLPIPPLDGGRVAVGILPAPLALPLARLERIGIFIVVGLFLFAPWLGRLIGVDLPLDDWLIIQPALWILDLIGAVTGIR